jgi:septum site-determining protein MinD
MARVFAVASAKGGVGKTTTTANVGAMLAATGADVVVVDGDIGMANLGAALGIDTPANTLHDVLSGTATPSEATYEGPNGVFVVPGETALSAYAEADPGELQSVINVHSQADYVLIDVGAGISHETSLPLSIADEVLLVSTPQRDALQDTEKTRQLTDQLGGTVAGAVITRAEQSTPVSEIVIGTLGTEILATVPEDAAVPDALAVGEPLTDYAPRSPAAEGYRDLVSALTGIEPDRPPEPASTADAGSDSTTAGATAAGDPTAGDDVSDAGEEVTISESTAGGDETADADDAGGMETPETEQADGTAADNATGTAADDTGGAKTGQRPSDDIESKWAEAATGTGTATDEAEDAETTESIAEATDGADDPAAITESGDDTDPASEGDAGAVGSDAVAIDESEPSGETSDDETTEDKTTGDETTETGHPEDAITPAPADASTTDDTNDTDDTDDTNEDGVRVPASEDDHAASQAGDDEAAGEESGEEAASQTGDDQAASQESDDEATGTAGDSGSVDDDAIPFRDEDSGEVDPVEPHPEEHQSPDTETDAIPDDAEPVIPDAEGDDSGSAVPTELMGGPDDDDGGDDDDDESKGFLRRLLFG